MKVSITRLSNTGQQSTVTEIVPINTLPKLIDEIEDSGKFLKFGNAYGGGFSIWDYRLYPSNIDDDELKIVRDFGIQNLSYKSISGLKVPQYFLLRTHMNRYINRLILHPDSINASYESIGNETFIQQCRDKFIKYLCIPQEPEKIYQIKTFTEGYRDYWVIIELVDINQDGTVSNRPTSPKMLYNIDNPSTWQLEFVKVVIGLPDIPVDFTSGKWLPDIYPNAI
jgi:hypothetical protein